MIALYSRVSTKEQAEGYSIGEQQERLRAFAASFGWKDIKFYTDPGFSGAKLDRPAMQELIRDVKAGKISRVVVYKLDRLSRSQKDTLELIEDVFLPNGCEFVSMSESFDTSTAFGRAAVGILAVFAQLERDTIKERMTIGRVARAKAGFYHGSAFIPTGYEYVDSRLVVNEFEAMQVRELFKLYLSGKSPRALVEEFAARGYLDSHGGSWSLGRVKSVLKNPVYAGKVVFDGEVYEGTHEPIIDAETFEAVQDLINDRAETYINNRTGMVKSDLLLVGLCYCKKCGGSLVTQCGTRHFAGSTPVKYHYYRCVNAKEKHLARAKGLSCDQKSIRHEKLEAAIIDSIRELEMEPSLIEELRKDKKTEPDEKPILRQQIDRLDRQISRLVDLYASGSFDVDSLTEKVTSLRETRQKAQERLFSLEAVNSSHNAKKARESLSGFSDVVERADIDQLKLIIRTLINKIEYADGEVWIHWNFE